MNINDWLKQNDSARYEDKSLKESQRKAEQRRVDIELDRKYSEDNDYPMGLKDNDGW